jgi:CDP-glucose 4,6-dehydratase
MVSEQMLSGKLKSGVYNFGPLENQILTVGQVADLAALYWGKDAQWVKANSSLPRESPYLLLDSSKSRIELGWREKFTAQDAIKMTLEWARRSESGESARDLTLRQVDLYNNK